MSNSEMEEKLYHKNLEFPAAEKVFNRLLQIKIQLTQKLEQVNLEFEWCHAVFDRMKRVDYSQFNQNVSGIPFMDKLEKSYIGEAVMKLAVI